MSQPIEIASVDQWNTSLRTATAQGRTVIVDFHAVWCGPCKAIAPTFSKLAATYPQAVFLRVDVDQQPKISAKYQVSAMPTFFAIKAGKQVDTTRGADIRGLTSMVVKHVGPNPPVAPLPVEAEAAKMEGNAAFGKGEWQAAVDAYTRAIEHAPKSAVLHANRSLAYLRMGTDESESMMKAVTDAKVATELDPKWAKGWSRLGDTLLADANNYTVKEQPDEYSRLLEAAQEAFQKAVGLSKEQGLHTQLADIQKKLEGVKRKLSEA